VNVSRGGFRLWVVLTALWLAFVAFLGWDEVSIATRGRYQYAPEMRDGIENPFDQEHIAKPFALSQSAAAVGWPTAGRAILAQGAPP